MAEFTGFSTVTNLPTGDQRDCPDVLEWDLVGFQCERTLFHKDKHRFTNTEEGTRPFILTWG